MDHPRRHPSLVLLARRPPLPLLVPVSSRSWLPSVPATSHAWPLSVPVAAIHGCPPPPCPRQQPFLAAKRPRQQPSLAALLPLNPSE
ncbi:MAG: hypothetical protein J6Y05_06035 [Bacteroidales bacterium]|nr:hypothetical protein [Bacteroidales bacterium]